MSASSNGVVIPSDRDSSDNPYWRLENLEGYTQQENVIGIDEFTGRCYVAGPDGTIRPLREERHRLGYISRLSVYHPPTDPHSVHFTAELSSGERYELEYSLHELRQRRDLPPDFVDNLHPGRPLPWWFIEQEIIARGVNITRRSEARIGYSWNEPAANILEDLRVTDEWMRQSIGLNPPSRSVEELRRISRERQEAQEKAWSTLLEYLTPKQRDDLKNKNCFTVIGEHTKTRYTVDKGTALNVKVEKNGEPQARYCLTPKGNLPTGDVMLTQVLLLQTDERKFLRVANRQSSLPGIPATGPSGIFDELGQAMVDGMRAGLANLPRIEWR